MHVAVIGAGAAGLCAARHLTSPNSGFTCIVFEQTDSVGGTWVYTEATEEDKYGLPIFSAMYKNLRTNLPKENMEYPGFPFVNPKSFVTAAEVLKYIENYAGHYGLKKHIKFHHHVKHVIPKEGKWQITSVDLSNDMEIVEEFDAVIIGNGHYSVPYMGDFPDTSEFEGEVKHSHCYRTPQPFTNKVVLICGGGPSGIDISFDMANYASEVYFSHRSDLKQDEFPENIRHVPVVKLVKKDHVIFEDGRPSGYIDVILVCTGYKYDFPFLAPECGITVVDGKFVQPLYKHIININYPTMAFIGIVFRSFIFPLYDHQVRFFLKTLNGETEPISQDDMLAEHEQNILEMKERGVPVKRYHDFSMSVKHYIDTLSELAQLQPLPPVIYSIYNATANLRKKYLSKYRDAVFEIISDNEFKMSNIVIDDLEPNQLNMPYT